MIKNFAECLSALLEDEGGFVNNSHDPGGMTNLGVTKTTWENWSRRTVTEQEMRELNRDLVAPLYQTNFWDAVKGDNLPTGVDYVVFDFAVNGGPGRARKFIQEAAGVEADGSIGPGTLAAIASMDAIDLVNKFTDIKEEYYKSLSTFETFGKGWLARAEKVQGRALKMIGIA